MDAVKDAKLSVLENVLDEINTFPGELKDTLTKIRELDLQVENGMNEQIKQIDEFFKVAEQLSAEERKKLFDSIKEAFEIIVEDADAKIDLVSALHMGLKAYLGEIEERIEELKEYLERAGPGITTIIERKVAAETSSEQNDAPPPRRKNTKKKVPKKKKW